jgi:hypothetical protein
VGSNCSQCKQWSRFTHRSTCFDLFLPLFPLGSYLSGHGGEGGWVLRDAQEPQATGLGFGQHLLGSAAFCVRGDVIPKRDFRAVSREVSNQSNLGWLAAEG